MGEPSEGVEADDAAVRVVGLVDAAQRGEGRHFGYGIARAYAGHTHCTGPAAATYIKADLQAVATALSAMTGQPHPLAQT